MNPADYEWARPYLHSDEQILWRGKPAKLHVFESVEEPFLVFGCIWTALVLYFFVIPTLRTESFGFNWILSILFLLVGMYVAFGRLFQKTLCLRKASYVITSYRVLVRIRKRVHYYNKSELPPVTVIRYSDGEGSIILKQAISDLPHAHTHPMFADMRNVIHSIKDVDAALSALYARNP